jgi:hypothetical protein
MIDHKQWRKYIIQPALQAINLYSLEAEELLIATMAHESLGFSFMDQVGGPALGPYEMEPPTYKDLWTYISRNRDLAKLVLRELGYGFPPPANYMAHNLWLATMMARIFYMRVNVPLPAANDIDAIWQYYKLHWNTEKGSATKDAFIFNYRKFIGANDEKGTREEDGKERVAQKGNAQKRS